MSHRVGVNYPMTDLEYRKASIAVALKQWAQNRGQR